MAGFLASVLRLLFPSTFPPGTDLFRFSFLDFERYVLRFRVRPGPLGRRLGWLYLIFLFLLFVWDPLDLLLPVRPAVYFCVHFLVVDCWMAVAALPLSMGRSLPVAAQLLYFHPFPRPITGWLFFFDSRAFLLAGPLAVLFGEFLRLWWSYPYGRVMAKKMWLPFDREIPMSLFWLDYYYVQGCLILGAEEMEDREAPIPLHREEWYYIRTYYPHYLFFTYSVFFALWLFTRLLFFPVFLVLGCVSFLFRFFGLISFYRFAIIPIFRFLLSVVSPPLNFLGGYLYPLVVPYVRLIGACFWIWGTVFWAFCEDSVRENDLWEVFLVSDLNFAFERYVMRRWWKRKVFYYFRRRLFFSLRPGRLATSSFFWPFYLPLLLLFYRLSRLVAFLVLGLPRYLWHTIVQPLLTYTTRRYVLPFALPLRRRWHLIVVDPFLESYDEVVLFLCELRLHLHFSFVRFSVEPFVRWVYVPLFRKPVSEVASSLRALYMASVAPRLHSSSRSVYGLLRRIRFRLFAFVDAYSEIHYFPVAYIVWYVELAFFPVAVLLMASPWGLWLASQFPYVYTYSDYAITVGLFAVAYFSSHRFRDWLWWDLKEYQLLVLGLCLALKAALLRPLTWIGGVLGKFIWSALALMATSLLLPIARAYHLTVAASVSALIFSLPSLPFSPSESLLLFPLVFHHLFPTLSDLLVHLSVSAWAAIRSSVVYAVPLLLTAYDFSYAYFSVSIFPVLLIPLFHLVAVFHYVDRGGWLLLVWLWSWLKAGYLAILPYVPVGLAEGPLCFVFFC